MTLSAFDRSLIQPDPDICTRCGHNEAQDWDDESQPICHDCHNQQVADDLEGYLSPVLDEVARFVRALQDEIRYATSGLYGDRAWHSYATRLYNLSEDIRSRVPEICEAVDEAAAAIRES